MELVSGKYNYLRRAAVLNFENNVITIELDIAPTNKESGMDDFSSRKYYTAAAIEKQTMKDNIKTSINLVFISQGLI